MTLAANQRLSKLISLEASSGTNTIDGDDPTVSTIVAVAVVALSVVAVMGVFKNGVEEERIGSFF